MKTLHDLKNKAVEVLESKSGRIDMGMIKSTIVVLILMVILFSLMADIIPTTAIAFHNLSDALAGQATVIGTAPATFAGNTDDYLGWFWAAGPLLLAIALVAGIFFYSKSGRRRRGRY